MGQQPSDDADDNFGSDQDEFLDKRRKLLRPINLYLLLPGQEQPELVRDYQAKFYDTHTQYYLPTTQR